MSLDKNNEFYLTEKKRTMHIHCLGLTGSGKTSSVIFPFILQDAIAGKGILLIDAKGSQENINAMYNICAVTHRLADLRILSMTFPDLSHTYNPLFARSIDIKNPKNSGDPDLIKERVMAVFKEDMENPYYRNVADTYFKELLKVLHGIVDEQGISIPFNMSDVLTCVQDTDILHRCCQITTNKEAAVNLSKQISSLGHKLGESLSGFASLLSDYTLPHLSSYQPDIILEDVLENDQIVYCQLPANFKGKLSLQIGKMILQDLQQAASRRQIYRHINQKHFAVYVDEFYNFAFEGMINALNKLRDANIQILLAHQSISDLECVSKEFAMGIWDNTRTKIVLYQNNAKLCEEIAKSVGTYQTVKTTARKSIGTFFTQIHSGEQSVRDVEEFVLHPNRIKNLAPEGQAYVIEGSRFVGINFGMIPTAFFKEPHRWNMTPQRQQISGQNLKQLQLSQYKHGDS